MNSDDGTEPFLKAAIAHLWFVTIHPFADGNGRISRTIMELLLARADGTEHRYYSISKAILSNKKDYYDILEKTQSGNMDLTAPTGKPVGFWWIGLHHVRTPFSGFGTRAAA